MNEVHAGSCGTAFKQLLRSEPERYCLHDSAGQPIGTIAAPAERPQLGISAPTVYLRRDL